MSEALINKLAVLTPRQREEHKKRLVGLYKQADKRKPDEARAALEKLKGKEKREQEEEGWKLTPHEIELRVHEIRAHLETFNQIIMGLHFDIVQPDTPFSLDSRRDDMESSALAERLNPTIAGRWKRLQDHLYETDEVSLADNDLGPMKWALADTAFGIGVLAGAIFSGASDREIERLERGLVYATAARPNEVKEERP